MKTIAALLLLAVTHTFAAEFDIRDKTAFRKLVPSTAAVKKLAGGMGFIEGPAWYPHDGGFLIFSDIPRNQLKKWSEKDGLSTFRETSNNANGNTIDHHGRLLTAEHGARRVSVTAGDGTVSTVVDTYDGKKFNSPNDVVMKSDGTIWFTDPDYGLRGRTREQPGNYVYRFQPADKTVHPVVKDFVKPNGLCFSPDEKKLYVADSGPAGHIRVFDVESDNTLANGKVFAKIDKGVPDGIRCDKAGNVWSSAGDGVHIFAPKGNLIGKILVPEAPANLGFGGPRGKTLYMTARTSLYSIGTTVE